MVRSVSEDKLASTAGVLRFDALPPLPADALKSTNPCGRYV